MLEPIYVALLQAAMRSVPEGTLTIDLAAKRQGIPDDGLDLIIRGGGDGTYTATLMPHDEAQASMTTFMAEAEFMTTDPDTGARLIGKRVDHGDGRVPHRGLVERFRAARGG